jgi:hypothetical protein
VAKGNEAQKSKPGFTGEKFSLHALFQSVISPSVFQREFNLQEQIKESNTENAGLVLGTPIFRSP